MSTALTAYSASANAMTFAGLMPGGHNPGRACVLAIDVALAKERMR